ncbi:ras and EF-hand domain-containing protein isoform X2 [Xenopus laevis]|uniref:Ras and EF-hand domain-containing protein isoform X2 n=1 Tax=Xenopus laevis TaxID=8355 RepID=A0A8J0UR90_XENLA|nr:ras and EF-hand domain-containing protein isoform X2 [Xenopus laevis]
MGSSQELAKLRYLFSACDVKGSGLVELEDFASVCKDLGVEPGLVRPLFQMLDADADGIIDFQDFTAGFEEVSQTLNLQAFHQPQPSLAWEELQGRLRGELQHLSSSTKEWLYGFYQDLQGVSVPGLIQQYERVVENVSYDLRAQRLNIEKLESVLKRTEGATAKQIAEMEEDLQHHLTKMERQIREEEAQRLNAAVQELQRKHEMETLSLQTKIDQMTKRKDERLVMENKEESTKLKNQIFDLSQENEQLKMTLLRAQTDISLLQTEVDRLKDYMTDQQTHHNREKEQLKSMVEERRTFTNQIQILNEANKSLYDNNDSMRSTLSNLENERKRHSSPSHLSEPSVITYSSFTVDDDPYRKFSDVATWADRCIDSGVSLPRSVGYSDVDSEFGSEHSNSSEERWNGSIHYANSDIESEVDGKLKWSPSRPLSRADSSASSKRKLPAFTPRKQGVPAEEVSQASSPIYRLVLAGDAGSGKSSFLLRLCLNEFRGDIPTTLGVDFQIKKLMVDGDHTTLQIWDTAGQERFRSIAKSYFRKAHGVLLMYDVTSERSFLNVRQWIDEIKNTSDKPIPMMLIGNKTDIRTEMNGIQTSMGEKLAMAYSALFCETSAKDGTNVVEAVLHLAREVKKCTDLEVENKEPVTLLGIQDKKSNCCKM